MKTQHLEGDGNFAFGFVFWQLPEARFVFQTQTSEDPNSLFLQLSEAVFFSELEQEKIQTRKRLKRMLI